MDAKAIWWQRFCGNDSLRNAFWTDDLTMESGTPDLTDCFQSSVVVWIPSLLIILGTCVYVSCGSRRHERPLRSSLSQLGCIQLMGIVLLICANYYDLARLFTNRRVQPVHVIASACKIKAFTCSLILHVQCSKRGIYNTGLAFFFWLLTFIGTSIAIRSRLIGTNSEEVCSTLYVQYAVIVVEFLFTFIADAGSCVKVENIENTAEGAALLGDGNGDKNAQQQAHPEDHCSFPTYLFFTWFIPMLWKGYKQDLVWSDVWKCSADSSCARIVPKFQKHWKRQVSKEAKIVMRKAFTATGDSSDCSSDDSTDSGFGDAKSKVINDKHEYGQKGKNDEQKTELEGKEEEKKDDLKDGKGHMIAVALLRTLGRDFIAASVLINVVENLCPFLQPFLLEGLMNFVTSGEPHVWKGLLYATLIFCTAVTCTICGSHHGKLNSNTQLRIRTALSTAIYRKALKLSTRAKSKRTEGEIVNLMSVDAEKVSHYPHFLHWFWMSPLTFCVSLYLLWQYIGPSCMLGILYLFCVLPITSTYMSRKFVKLDKEKSELKDERIKLTNQVLSGIKVLKLYGWEPHFQKKVNEIRAKETDAKRQHATLSAINEILWHSTPFVMASLCFGGYVLSNPSNVLNAEIIFVTISLLDIIRVPIGVIPHLITYGSECFVSAKRVSKFLQLEEIDEGSITHNDVSTECISIKNGTFTWGEKKRSLLSCIDLDVEKGSLVAVVGEVGSGKSSLISAILGEMIKLEGHVNIVGAKAYVPQQAWIQNMSLRNNVLFGKEMQEDKYKEVLESCALKHDLSILPGGDLTEIGEKGITLSGGQKQRISLARAVYQDTDIYLFDDPLSAVDSHVGKHIFENVIGHEGVLKNKTRILVTNQIQYLAFVDEIIVMDDCVISERGSYIKLMELNGRFAEFIKTHDNVEKSDDSAISNDSETAEESDCKSSFTLQRSKSQDENKSGLRKRKTIKSKSRHVEKKEINVADETKENLVEEEKYQRGSMDVPTLGWYVKAVSVKFSIFSLLCIFAHGGLEMMSNIWLACWGDDSVMVKQTGITDESHAKTRLGVYTALGIAQAVSVAGFTIMTSIGSIKAGRAIHNLLLENVMKMPTSFFDRTPLGRIVNRFSKDLDSMDGQLPGSLRHALHCVIPLVTSFLVITYNLPLFITVLVPLLLVFFYMKKIFTACARQLQFMSSMSRSPVFSFFSETLNGVTSIRAYDCQERFERYNQYLVDNNTSAEFSARSANRWLGLNGYLLANFAILSAALFVVVNREFLSAATVGLIISYSFRISGELVGILHASCGLETAAVSVERLKEYAEKQTEAPWSIAEKKPPTEWPERGEVVFKNFSMRYRQELPLVLKNLSCKIQPSEKVGIVGRTGAGKSSVTMALFRIIEASNGSISIDGRDISELGLHDLRRNLAIIPQDPVLFSGTLKFNLDPAGEHNSEELWKALELSNLSAFVKTLPKMLEYECGEDGKNLSVGQRQLVCLARALLRKAKILVLDEATASVDMDTDLLIQNTIRSEFADCTVITIAHRLNTIVDYDKIMVMENGTIKEFESPRVLLKNKNSVFYSMANDAGIV